MNRPLLVAILLIFAVPACAQDQLPNVAKLKADAQKVVGIIKGDKGKAQVYCEINNLGEQIGEADQKKDDKKAEALSQQIGGAADRGEHSEGAIVGVERLLSVFRS